MADTNRTSILKYIIEKKTSIEEFIRSEVKYDEEIDSWMLVNDPWTVFIIIIVYLLFVMKIGPKMMANRPPYQITNVILIFNLIQFSYNSLLCLWIVLTPGIPKYIFTHLCHVSKETQSDRYLIRCLHTVSWFYFISKIIDLLDTVRLPSEQAAYGAMLNSSVHIAMYGYYFFAALGPYMQKYLWWKVYVTRLQITQLFIAMAYVIYLYKFDCSMPKALSLTIVIDLFVFICLFMNFYKTAYNEDKKIGTSKVPTKSKKESLAEKKTT